MNAVFRILRYLKSAPVKGLLFSKSGVSNIEGYTDFDWARSTSGYFTFMVILSLREARSRRLWQGLSAEAKFQGMAHGV